MSDNTVFLQSIGAIMKTLKERVDFTEAELAMLAQHIRLSSLKKNELLVAEGTVENRIHYIVEGVTRSFFIRGGKDISFEFYFPGMFISSYASFLDRTPSAHSIEAFTSLTVLSIQHADMMQLYEKSKNFEHFGRIFTEELFKKTSERNRDLLSLTATERYMKLLEVHTHYVQAIPLKYLASYLNITPESLSRIRKNL
jgi:CRP-like cAMP-binding protein